MKPIPFISLVLLAFTLSQTSYAQTFSSTHQQVNLVELYTSEGCSSCPPADRWLSKLTQKPGLWNEFIPLSLHVDYWDYIGWQDPFADKRYTQRQYNYYHTENLSSIYTPGVLFNGQEWRSWRQDNWPEPAQKGAGQLSIHVEDDTLSANYQTQIAKSQSLILNIAILGFDLTSEIDAGENHGKKLKHDFVVLGYRTAALQPNETGFSTQQNITLPTVTTTSERYAIATWVNTFNDPKPIQATGGWLD